MVIIYIITLSSKLRMTLQNANKSVCHEIVKHIV